MKETFEMYIDPEMFDGKEGLVERLCELLGHPVKRSSQGVPYLEFQGELCSEAEATRKLCGFLKEHGVMVCFADTPDSLRKKAREKGFRIERVWPKRIFDESEIESARFFHFWVEMWEIADVDIETQWKRGLHAVRSTVKSRRIGHLFDSNNVVCQDEVKQRIEAQKFVDLGFREVPLLTGRSKKDVRLWLLESGRLFPPVQNRFVVEGKEGRETTAEYPEKGLCLLADKAFPKILRYRLEDLDALEGVDVGRTREIFGTGGPGPETPPDFHRFPMMIGSRRFREWCIKEKIRLDWVPVIEI